MERLVHELEVHQIELEMQNEELQSAQRLIAESREKYVDLYDFAPVGYFSFDRNGVITEMNLTGASLIGIERAYLIGKPFSLFLNSSYGDIFFAHRRKTQQTGQAGRCELLIQRKDGSLVPVLMESVIVADTTGSVTIRSAVTDITEHKRMEEAAARLAAIVESSDDAIIAKSLDGTIVSWNEGAERLYGYSAAEAIGRFISFLVPPHLHEDLSLILTRIKRGEHIRHFETTRQKKDGTMVDVSLTISPIFNSGGEAIGASTIARDVTERKQAEDAVHRSRDQLELMVRERTAELQESYDRLVHETVEREHLEEQLRHGQKMEALGTLTGGIAHDFNNMLAAIMGFTELAADNLPKGSTEAHHLKRVMEASFRGRDLVRQMLAYARQTEQEKKPVRLSSIVAETVEFLRASTPSTVKIKVAAKSESGPILGDPTQIQQVLMNLCTNAVHAMQEKGGVLDIEFSNFSVPASHGSHGMKPGPYMRLIVRDTGKGIPPDILDRIFDPFFTTKGPGEGTGLGLSVVQGIVKQSNGYITVVSQPGKGSTFTVRFPRITEEAAPDAPGDEEPPTGCERILFLDDDEALVEMGQQTLTKLGYTVTSRMSSREALALLKKDPSLFDLVITDQTMPDMTGVDLARKILALRPDMPIIMCTGFSRLVDADKAEAAGIKAFAMKPVTKREIARTIRKVLDG
jgi:PAS domain S-box-containing protein